MNEVLPAIFARSKRGICPTCGAALRLKDSERHVTCGFCGGRSSLERRLRKMDADVDLPELGPGEGPEPDTRWLAAALGELRAEKVTCPGCGDEFEGLFAHEILTCPSCATQSKVERRMVRPEAQERAPPQRRTHADFVLQARGDPRFKWDVQTEQLIWRILNEPDLERKVALAQKFEDWCYINATTVYFLPHLLALAKLSDLRLAGPICDCVGKLLCQEDARLFAPTLEACEPFALDPRGCTELFHQIGLGNARGMKLLLDAADAAARAGAIDYTANALWAAHYVIERNYDEHTVIAEIMLYRLFYLSPMVMGWVLYVIQSGEGGYVFKDPYALLEFIDDCAFERPELVSFLAKRPYAPEVTTLAEMRERLKFIEARQSKPGKGAALAALANVAMDAPTNVLAEAVEFAEPWLDDPDLREAATAMLRRYIKWGEGIAPPLVKLIRRRMYSLPEIVQREVHWKTPDNTLLDFGKIPPYYDGEPEVPLEHAVANALEAYDAAIREAVEKDSEERNRASEFWDKARELDVKVFDEDDLPRDA
jgi:hypothetical protein